MNDDTTPPALPAAADDDVFYDATNDIAAPAATTITTATTTTAGSTAASGGGGGGGGGGGYVAVRAGYAALPPPQPPGAPATTTTTIAVRSAIFLSWEDARSFVEHHANLGGGTTTTDVEYRRFDDLESAERYLRRAMPGYDKAAEAKRRAKSKRQQQQAAKAKARKTKGKKKNERIAHRASSAGSAATWSLAKIRRLASLPHRTASYPPPKGFNPPTKKWNAMHEMAIKYASTHDGNLDVPTTKDDDNDDEGYAELAKWIKYQRASYGHYLEDPLGGRHSMTEEKVRRLKEVGFSWIEEDKAAYAAGGEEEDDNAHAAAGGGTTTSIGGKKKRGRPRKTARMRLEEDLAIIVASPPTRPIRPKWMANYDRLKEYATANGNIDIGSDVTDEGLVELRVWIKNQKNMHARWRQGHDVGMTKEKEDLLKELGMEFAPSWEDMHAKVVQHKARNAGSIDGITSESDPILAAWIARQDDVLSRHLQGKSTRLSDEQAMRLLSLGLQGGRGKLSTTAASAPAVAGGKTVASRDFDARWNEMWLKLKDYRAENGHCNVPTSSSNDLSLWVAAQRRMYNKLVAGKPGKRASLDAVKMQRLTELGFAFRPRGSYAAWDDQMKGLWDFKAANGHCRIPVNHPTLGSFVKLVRRDYKNWSLGKPSSMTPEREAALKEVGFAFEGGKTPLRADVPVKSWDERLEELLQYKAEYGHTVVPQNSGQLGAWVHSQRVHYKRYKNGQKSQMTAEKALRLTEIGFCFNASDRYRGNKRHRVAELQEEEEAQLLQQQLHQQQQQQGYQQMHQLQDTVHVPQGFQAYM